MLSVRNPMGGIIEAHFRGDGKIFIFSISVFRVGFVRNLDFIFALSLFDSDLEQCCFEYEERHHEPTVNGQQTIADDPKLEQNEPNPFRENSTIRYYLPSTVKIAQLQITDLNGAVLKTFNLKGKGFGQVLISGGSFRAGTYIYSLIIDGEKTDSKRMILL